MTMLTHLLRWPWFVWHMLSTRRAAAWGIFFFCQSTNIQVNFHTYILLFFLWIYISISFPLFFIITFLEHPYAYWFVLSVSICAMICVSMISRDLLFLQESALVLQLSCFDSLRNHKYLYIFLMDYQSQSTILFLSLSKIKLCVTFKHVTSYKIVLKILSLFL